MIATEERLTDIQYQEKMVLAKAIHSPENRKQLKLLPEHFEDPRHGAILQFLKDDYQATKEDIMALGIGYEQKKYGNFDFVSSITDFDYVSKHGIGNAQMQVYDSYKKREISRLTTEYTERPSDDNEQALTERIKELNEFNLDEPNRKMKVISEIFDDLHSDNSNTVIRTGFKSLDALIGGFEDGQLNVIAARPSVGKTAIAIQMGMQLSQASENNKVVFCSMETKEKNIVHRLLSNISKVDLYKFRNPNNEMSFDEIERVVNALDIYNKMNFDVYEKASMTPSVVRNIAHRMEGAEHNFIIIDYLQLMSSEKRHGSKYEEVSHISRELKMIAQECQNVTIIAIAQLNRGIESRQDKRPMMSDIRDSGNVEQDCNLVMTLYRDDYYERDKKQSPGTPSDIDVMVLKNKDGATGNVRLKYYKEVQRFY